MARETGYLLGQLIQIALMIYHDLNLMMMLSPASVLRVLMLRGTAERV
jgi:hypothetical protein